METTNPLDSAPTIHADPDFEPAPHLAADGESVSSPGEGFIWRGVKLHEFTGSRRSLFSQHRLAIGAPPLARVLVDIDGFFADALRILWLCSHTQEDWAELRCRPVELEVAIGEWSDQIETDPVAAVLLGMQIFAHGLPG